MAEAATRRRPVVCGLPAWTRAAPSSGMGELHLEIYCERLRREENIEVTTGKPYVKYREVCVRTPGSSILHWSMVLCGLAGTADPLGFGSVTTPASTPRTHARVEEMECPDLLPACPGSLSLITTPHLICTRSLLARVIEVHPNWGARKKVCARGLTGSGKRAQTEPS